jgi:hypothetical protein
VVHIAGALDRIQLPQATGLNMKGALILFWMQYLLQLNFRRGQASLFRP